MARTLGFATIVSLCCAVHLTAIDTPSDRMFERLRGLAGEWEGTFEWSQGRPGGKLRAAYYSTGNGSALVENLIMGDAPTMTTIYHLDGPDLRMTHYCAAMNQPRLKATRVDESAGVVEFSFVDITNATAANPAHVEGFVIRLLDAGRLNLSFTFGGGPGKGAVENIMLERIRAAAAQP